MSENELSVKRVAAILREHDLFYDRVVGEYECDCGHTYTEDKVEDAQDAHAAHQAEKVVEA